MSDLSHSHGFDHVLAQATDPSVMHRLFVGHLVGDSAVVECRVARYRHRSMHRCLVQYVLQVRSRGGRVSEHVVSGQWHAEAGRAAHLFRKLGRRAMAECTDWAGPWPPVFFDEATGMLGTTYPWDRRLISLPAVASGSPPDVVAPMLRWMGLDPGSIATVAVHTIRYREQLSAVCRYTLDAGTSDGSEGPDAGARHPARFYVKLYPDDQGARAFATLTQLALATSGSADAARVERPVAYLSSRRALVLAQAPGVTLDAFVGAQAPDAAVHRALGLVARRLAGFARLTVVPAATRVDTLAPTHRAAAAVAEALPDLAAAVGRIHGAGGAGGPATGLVHGDVKLEHVFVTGDDVWLIDVDSAHVGDPRWDWALLFARWWAATDASPATPFRRDAGARVIDEVYRSEAPPAWCRAIECFKAKALLDVAAGIVKRQETDWSSRAARAVLEGCRMLEDA